MRHFTDVDRLGVVGWTMWGLLTVGVLAANLYLLAVAL